MHRLVRSLCLLLTLALPQIWTSSEHPLEKRFLKFISLSKSNSSQQYWRRISDLFEVLRKKSERTLSDLINWASKGMLASTGSELDPSNSSQTAFTILVNVISDMEDDESRIDAWKTNFVPHLHRFLTSTDSKRSSEVKTASALGSALLNMSIRRLSDFDKIWNAECEYLIGLMPGTSLMTVPEPGFKTISQRWVNLTLSILRLFAGGKLEAPTTPELTSFLRIISRPFEKALEASSNMGGTWVDGTAFIASLVDDSLFSGCVLKADEMDGTRQKFKEFVDPTNLVKQLHSASSGSIIRIIVAFCSLYSKELPEVWETLVNEAIPEARPVEVHDPNSLLAQVVASVESLTLPYLKLPERVNINLVNEMTAALHPTKDAKAIEMKRREDLFVSLVCLRGLPRYHA
jgi:hypothetical protein